MIQVENLNFTYPGTSQKTIEGIDFEIRRGEIFGFLGPSGAGKTTTQRIIIGLLSGYIGHVQIMGRERREWRKDFFEKIGVVFEYPNLYQKLTALENLNLLGSYYQKKTGNHKELLDQVGLLQEKDKKVEGFSKGMKMRLNFIRSLLHDPDLFFLDEPTSGLDPVNAKIIKNMILELQRQGKTIFLTTHNMVVADELCDSVAFIVKGKIPVIDTPKNLKIQHGKKRLLVQYTINGQEKMENFSLKAIGENQAFLKILKEAQIKTMHTQEATLEDIFIKLTGRDLI